MWSVNWMPIPGLRFISLRLAGSSSNRLPDSRKLFVRNRALYLHPHPTRMWRVCFGRLRIGQAINWLLPFAAILFLVAFYFAVIEPARYLWLAPVIAIERIYRQLYRSGRPLAGEYTKAETAYEFMQKLSSSIEAVMEPSRLRKFLSSSEREITLLTDLYQDTLFTEHSTQKQDARSAWRIWQHLRWRLMVARIIVMARKIRAERSGFGAQTKRMTKQSPYNYSTRDCFAI